MNVLDIMIWNHRAARLAWLVASVVLWTGPGYGAEALKPRTTFKKPQATAVIPASHELHRISVKFADDSKVRLRDGSLVDLGTGSLVPADELLTRLAMAGAVWRREHSIPEARLDELRESGQSKSGGVLPDLNTAFVLELTVSLDPAKVIDQLNALEVVELAVPVPRQSPPPVVGDYESEQGYLDAAGTNGVNARHAWTIPGGNGANVQVVDIEYDWNLNHDDLNATLLGGTPMIPASVVPFNPREHGTAVLGVMGGRSDGIGVKGIAWGSTFFVAAVATGPNTNVSVADAITTALARLSPGDVIVLEQQMDGPAMGTNDFIPVEWFKPIYDAVVMAVKNEVIVVEAAGNGNQNLDDPLFDSGHKPFQELNDSGAILVGAGAAAGVTNRARLPFSTHGSAVHLQAWGESVVTTGYGDRYGTDGVDAFYTRVFNGTSSASAIIGGVVAAVQGAHRARFGENISIGPAEMRAILQATGTPQTGVRENIGPLPDLAEAIPLALARRIWVDFAYTGTPEGGTVRFPAKTLPLAIQAVPTGGAIVIKGGSTPWTGTITKPLTLHGYRGAVTIGQ